MQLTPPGSACSVVLGEGLPLRLTPRGRSALRSVQAAQVRRAGAVLDRVLESIRKPELSP